jgi:phosphoglycolate phosphatase-like HAD superfamily hydrolase
MTSTLQPAEGPAGTSVAAARAIVLDFDGVIVESNEVKTAAFQELFSRHPSVTDAMMRFHLEHQPRPRRVKFARCAELLDRAGDGAFVAGLEEAFSRIVAERVAQCALVPGAEPFLQEFSTRVPLYLASVTPVDELRSILQRRGLIGFFTGVYGDPPTAKRDALSAIAAREGITPGELLFIGDAQTDWQAARDAGVPFVGRDSGMFDAEAPIEKYADLIEIARVVRGRIRG